MAVNDSMAAIESSGSSNMPSDANSLASASSLKNRPRNIPGRSGSAPPNFEEAFAAIRNPMFIQQSSVKNVDKGVLDREAEERLLTDPEYIAYYNAHVNLNPRLPPPHLSRETRHLVGRNVRLSYARKLDSCDDNGDLNIKPRLLPTHQEDLEDDILTQQQTLEDQTQLLVQDIDDHTRALGSADPPSTSFPLGKSDGSKDNMAVHNSTNLTIAGAGTVLNPSNISGASVSEHVGRRHEDMLLFEAYGLPVHQVQRFQPQFVPQVVNGPHNGMTMFPGMKPVMHHPGLVPAPYASTAPYMTGNQFGPRLQTLSNFSSQLGLRGYTFPPGFYPPYLGGYAPQNMFTQTLDPFVARNLLNRAIAVQPHFPSPLQGQYFQHSFMDNAGRDSAQSSQYDNLLAQKESNLASFMYHDHRNLSNVNVSSSDVYTAQKDHRGSNDVVDTKRHVYLEALKFGGGAKLELYDIAGKVVEFSTDQHGSRFIQQKLEISTVQEKEFVFTELLPHASQLMTDVYGNYVVQKLFEHGTSYHKKQLADQITGQMLTLSLQMYGCRVIQKALEVIELDQKTLLARELDGHVIKCVHDQNGNHVIQKCIEHIPAEKIGFIVSALHGEVATLSVHPYGCRVIQRVLEHCPDTPTTHFVMDEILESAYMLAHDQYGNYVIQHVLQLGKPHERSQVISKLGGKFVEMSQHKYASNVIEKCLVYGDASVQESLIKEIVGKSQEDANLVIMMKDQYANYVIQRIIDICKDEEMNILMKCIAENLQSLKKYTYGKHIVARYEQLLSGVNQEQTAG